MSAPVPPSFTPDMLTRWHKRSIDFNLIIMRKIAPALLCKQQRERDRILVLYMSFGGIQTPSVGAVMGNCSSWSREQVVIVTLAHISPISYQLRWCEWGRKQRLLRCECSCGAESLSGGCHHRPEDLSKITANHAKLREIVPQTPFWLQPTSLWSVSPPQHDKSHRKFSRNSARESGLK